MARTKRRKHQEWLQGGVEERGAVYGSERQCLARVGRGKVTAATDNAGPADDTPGNVIRERTQQYTSLRPQIGRRPDWQLHPDDAWQSRQLSLLHASTKGYCRTWSSSRMNDMPNSTRTSAREFAGKSMRMKRGKRSEQRMSVDRFFESH